MRRGRKKLNPKDIAGSKKTPHHLVPVEVLEEVAWAMKEGADKYGPYNWREIDVNMSSYYSSTRRHMDAWFKKEDVDKESERHHVVKAIAGLFVLYDSILNENAVDDRP